MPFIAFYLAAYTLWAAEIQKLFTRTYVDDDY